VGYRQTCSSSRAAAAALGVAVGLEGRYVTDNDALCQNPLNTFHRNFSVDGEAADLLRVCWRADLLLRQQVRNKLATSR